MEKYSFEKTFSYIKGYAMALGLDDTIRALNFGRECHKDQKRNDGQSYFIHPLIVTSHAISLNIFEPLPVEIDNVTINPLDVLLATCLLHDVKEDCGIDSADLPVCETAKKYIEMLTYHKPVDLKGITDELPSLLSYEGKVAVSKKVYYDTISENLIPALVKMLDRCNNVSSMAGTFDGTRLEKYIAETNNYVIPMIYKAKANFPEYSNDFFILKYHIMSVVDSIDGCMNLWSPTRQMKKNDGDNT